MSDYSSELLDGFQEMLADFGTTVMLENTNAPIPVVAVFPDGTEQTEDAGEQVTGSFNFQVLRTAAVGIAEKVHFTVADRGVSYTVSGIEDDPALPILYVSAEVTQ